LTRTRNDSGIATVIETRNAEDRTVVGLGREQAGAALRFGDVLLLFVFDFFDFLGG
jgi:hypothetical protein